MDRKWWTLVAVCVGVFMLLLDVTIVTVALPDIQRVLGASLSDLQWVVDAYALTLAALLLTAGSVADLLGRRRVFAAGTAIFTAGSLLCGLATGPLFLAVARAGQGIGGATMFATALALIAQAFRGPDRGVAFGVFGAVSGVAVAAGPVLGGLITSELSWRWIFFVNVPVGVAAIAITSRMVDESRDPAARRPDWLGFVTFSGALALLIFGLIRSNADGWSSVTVAGSLVASAVLLAAFFAVEVLGSTPMLELRLLRKPTFTGGLVAAFGISASLFALLLYITLYLQNVLGFSPVGTGVRLLVLTGAIFVTAGAAGRLTTIVPIRLLIGPGFVLIGGGLLLMRGITASSSWTHLIPGLILAGAGAGLVNTPLSSTAVGVVEPARAGMASGINSTFRQVGMATGIAGFGALFSSRVRDSVSSALGPTPLAPHSGQVASAVGNGDVAHVVATTPAPLRGVVAGAARGGFVAGLNDLLLVGAVLAFAAAVACLALIRQRDFILAGRPDPTAAPGAAASGPASGPGPAAEPTADAPPATSSPLTA